MLVDGTLLAVADGVGGAPRGDLASEAAIETVQAVVDEPGHEPELAAVATELNDAVMIADAAVKGLADRWSELRGTATTMCAALVFARSDGRPVAIVANVGDSRCYHLRGEAIIQVTTDQTLAEQLRKAAVEDIASRAEHIVVSVLGGDPESSPQIDLYRLDLAVGDVLLLCTDGISGVLDPEELVTLSSRHPDPDQLATVLVRAAWDAGSTDNLTAVVATIGSG